MTDYLKSIDEALVWVNKKSNNVRKNSPLSEKLFYITHILSLLNNPQHHFKSIHITGSKGKSSTSYACSYFLSQMGIKTGLFTSPHIHYYNERIRINQKNIDNATLLKSFNTIYHLTQVHNLHLTMFEIFTAAACVIFKEQCVEYAVFEVGIGGTYDTTNILKPHLCIITNIEKEHTNILGDSLEEIASNKAGIIKENTPVFIGRQTHTNCLDILCEVAKSKQAPVIYLPHHVTLQHIATSPFYQKSILCVDDINTPYGNISSWHNKEIISHTPAPVIIENQILADIAIHTLLERDVKSHRVYDKEVQLMCRAEIINIDERYIFLDGAHTEESLHNALECMHAMKKKFILIFSLVKGKDYKKLLDVLTSYKHIIEICIISKAGNFRESEPQILHTMCQEKDIPTILQPDINEVMEYAMKSMSKNFSIAVLGSFFLCADCRDWLMKHLNIQ